jgi:hypothetical protein
MDEKDNGKFEQMSTQELVENIRMHTLVLDLLEFSSPRRQLAAIQSVMDSPGVLRHQKVVEALREAADWASPQVREEAGKALKLLPPS